MFLALLYVMVAAWFWYGAVLWLRERAMRTRGIDITAHVKGNETSDGSTFRPILGYTHGGRYYEMTYPYAGKMKYAVGTAMALKILAEKPEKPLRKEESLRRTYVFCFVVGALALLLALYITFLR